MEKRKTLIISICGAIIGAGMIFSYISNLENSIYEGSTPMSVVFALRDLPPGTRIDESCVELRKVPKKFLQPGFVGNPDDVLSRVVMVPVLKNTQLLETMFTESEYGGISSKIPGGKRAFTLQVDDALAVAQLIQPGDTVDVLATVEIGDIQEGQQVSGGVITKTILKNVLVLAVDSNTTRIQMLQNAGMRQKSPGTLFSGRGGSEDKERSLKSVTVALSPEETQKLTLAREIGAVSMSLRGAFEQETKEQTPSLTARSLLGIKKGVIPKWRAIEAGL